MLVLESFPHYASDLHVVTSEARKQCFRFIARRSRLHRSPSACRCGTMSCPHFRGRQSERRSPQIYGVFALMSTDSGGGGGRRGLSRWFEYLLPLSGVVRCSPGATLSLPVFVVLGVFFFLPSSFPFINTGTLVVFSRDYFLRLFLCLLNSLFCHHIYCFLYLEPNGAFLIFPSFSANLHPSLKKENKQKPHPFCQMSNHVLGKHNRGFEFDMMVKFMFQESRNVFFCLFFKKQKLELC